jgi:hypothetical protein
VGDAGPETTSKSSGKTPDSSKGGAENGALDLNLQIVIEAWPKLSEHRRIVIVGIAKAGTNAATEYPKN